MLFFADGTAGPLDYKFAKDPGRVYATLRLQSAIYALLIREHFGLPVRRGYLVYTRSYRTGWLKSHINQTTSSAHRRVVQEILRIVHHGTFSPAQPRPAIVSIAATDVFAFDRRSCTM